MNVTTHHYTVQLCLKSDRVLEARGSENCRHTGHYCLQVAWVTQVWLDNITETLQMETYNRLTFLVTFMYQNYHALRKNQLNLLEACK